MTFASVSSAPDAPTAGAAPAEVGAPPAEDPPGERRGPVKAVVEWLPHGKMLEPAEFARRHQLVCVLLAVHIPALYIFGLIRGYDPVPLLLEMTPAAGALGFSFLLRPGRLAAFSVTVGLVYCSAALVHLSGGMIEAHFHFFILIGFIALYQDWVPFIWNVFFVVVSHGLGSALVPEMMYNHHAAQHSPWVWAGIHGVSVAFACAGVITFWHYTEETQKKSLALARQLSAAQVATVAAEANRRQSISTLLVHLARRNQVLLDRQIGLLIDLEQGQRHPDELAELFKLDHLATRMRRNAESLLVLSGSGSSRRWSGAVPLSDVAMAAAAEVEDYKRVQTAVGSNIDVAGSVVADLTHLLAELIENATTFSPPSAPIRVDSYLAPDGRNGARFVVAVEDRGVGMPADKLAEVNRTLAEVPEVETSWTTLGFHVVARLARRHGLEVRLAETPGGGTTALVRLPDRIIREWAGPAGELPTAPRQAPPGAPVSGPLSATPSGSVPTQPQTVPSQLQQRPSQLLETVGAGLTPPGGHPIRPEAFQALSQFQERQVEGRAASPSDVPGADGPGVPADPGLPEAGLHEAGSAWQGDTDGSRTDLPSATAEPPERFRPDYTAEGRSPIWPAGLDLPKNE